MANRKKETSQPKITIVIGTFNRPTVVLKLLDQLKQIKKPAIEVLVYDQSNLENYQILKSNFPNNQDFHLIYLDKPNTCHYLNLGWQKSNTSIVLYLDDDVEITPETIQFHIDAYKSPNVMGVAGRVINENEQVTKETSIGKVKGFGAIFLKNFSSTERAFVDFPYGCNMSFRRKTLEEVNGFDEKLSPPNYSFNEVDLGYRINKKYPQSIIFEPEALVYHKRYPTGGTRSYSNKQVQTSNNLNYGYFIGKNFSFFENILFMLRRLPYQLFKEPKGVVSILNGLLKAKRHKNHLWSVLFAGVLALSVFLRFNRVPLNFSFDIDTQYQALLAKTIVKHFHIIWIGVSASNIGYYLGPGLVYLTAGLIWFSKGDPVILGYFASLVGCLTVLSVAYITNNLYGKKTALISTVFYGFSSFIVLYDRKYWPLFVPLIAVWIFYSLVKSRYNHRWLLVSIILIAASYHIHLSLLFFWPFILLTIVSCFKKIRLIDWILMGVSYLAITSPLLVFDFVHNFDNLLMPLRYIQNLSNNHISGFQTHFPFVISTIQKVFLEQNTITIPIFVLILCISLLSIIHSGLRRSTFLLISIVILFILMFSFYPGPLQEYYVTLVLPFIVIAFALFLKKMPQIIIVPLLILFVAVQIRSSLLTTNIWGLENKKKLIIETSRYLNDSYYLSFDNDRDYDGWRYLFEAYGKTPSSSQADSMFGWIYQTEISQEKPKLRVIISTTDQKPKLNIVKKVIVYPYTSYIVENE